MAPHARRHTPIAMAKPFRDDAEGDEADARKPIYCDLFCIALDMLERVAT
jgi:hypothetical protein